MKTIHRPGVIDIGSETIIGDGNSGCQRSLALEFKLSSTKQSQTGYVCWFPQSELVESEGEEEVHCCCETSQIFRCRSGSVATWACSEEPIFFVFLETTASSLATAFARGSLFPGAPSSTSRMSRPQTLRPPSSRSGSWQKLSASHTGIYPHQTTISSGRRMGTADAQIVHPHAHQFSLLRAPPLTGGNLQLIPAPAQFIMACDQITQQAKYTYG